jgi:membrane protein implicated in regulation of membrane protease activity
MIDFFKNPAVIWFLIGFVFFLLEFMVPGLILFFFAVGAWIVALLLLFTDLSINGQLLIFAGSAILTLVLFRRWLKDVIWTRKESHELIEDEFLGKTGEAETSISPGHNGKVYFKGTSWDASSDDTINKGEHVTIIGNDSILLIVKSQKTEL